MARKNPLDVFNAPRFDPTQEAYMQSALGGSQDILRGLGDKQKYTVPDFVDRPKNLAPAAQLAEYLKFKREGIPGLRESFTRLAPGSQRGSAFPKEVGRSLGDLIERLAAIQEDRSLSRRGQDLNYLIGARGQDINVANMLAQMGLQPKQETYVYPRQKSAGERWADFGIDIGAKGLERGLDVAEAYLNPASGIGKLINWFKGKGKNPIDQEQETVGDELRNRQIQYLLDLLGLSGGQ